MLAVNLLFSNIPIYANVSQYSAAIESLINKNIASNHLLVHS